MPDDSTSRPRLRVLVVDDDALVAGTIARVLGETYDVVVAHSADAAQAVLDGSTCHIVVSDVCMPRRSGIDLFEWIRERSPALAERVVFVTGGLYDQRAAAALAALDNPRLSKPFRARELQRVVDAIASRLSCARPGSPS